MREKILEKLIDALLSMPEVGEPEQLEGALPEGDGLSLEKTKVSALEDGEEIPLGEESEEDEKLKGFKGIL